MSPNRTNSESRRSTSATGYPEQPHRVVAIVCAVMFFGVLNASLVNVVLPDLLRSLSAGAGVGGWVISGYLLTYGVAIPVYGRLADGGGAKRLFLFGIGLFSVGSALCALAPSLALMILARVIQALGGAAFPGLGLAIASQAVPPQKRGMVLGAASATIGIGSAVGPLVGGVLTDLIHWRAVFVMSAGLLVLFPAAARWLPVERAGDEGSLDVVGGAALALFVVGLLLGFTLGSQDGWTSATAMGALGVAIISLVIVAYRQKSEAYPFLPTELVSSAAYRRIVFLSLLAAVAMLGTLMAFPLMLSTENGLDALSIGLAMLPGAIATAVFGMTAGRIVDRVGAGPPIRVGWAVMSAGMLLLVGTAGGTPYFMAATLAVVTTGFALFNTPLAAVISLTVRPGTLASAMSFNTMFFFVGGSIGAATVSSVLSAQGEGSLWLAGVLPGPSTRFSAVFLMLVLALFCAAPLLSSPFRGPEGARG